MSSGGTREGAGRPVGSPNRATVGMKARLSMLAREYTYTAFETLLDVCEHGTSETARIAAATALLDRGFGKPRMASFMQYSAPDPLDDILGS
ncbi:MAG: hypothetical protein R8K20_01255 [Gallionellaceae bacterium]